MNHLSTSKLSAPSVVCRALEADDLPSVEACLVRHFPERQPIFWRAGLQRLANREPIAGLPRYGYCLAAGDEIVGVLLQLYSLRKLASGSQTLCHLSSWCVDENYRVMAPILSIAATKRRDVTYVNISPAVHTRRGIEALGFKRYSHGQMIFAPILSRRKKGARIVSYVEGSAAERLLPENEREILAHHAGFGCRVFIGLGEGAAYGFVTAKVRVLRGRLSCEQVIYCRDTVTLASFAGAIGAYLGARGTALCVVDANEPVAGLAGRFVADREPKYFKGPTPPAPGDLAYSELALFNNPAVRHDLGGETWLRRLAALSRGAGLSGTPLGSRASTPWRAKLGRSPKDASDSRAETGNVWELERGRLERNPPGARGLTVLGETASAPAILTGLRRVRALSAHDLPQVAAMFRGIFRETCDAGSAALTRDLETIFLEHPHYDETTSSLVYERPDGEVAAFFGCLPLRMNFMGSRQLGSIMSTWMVGDRTRDPRAGAMLLQTHLKRRHPFTLADTANSTSLEFANSIKITPLTTHCLQWIKPLNYCGYAISSVGGGKDSRTLRALTRFARESENGFRRLTRERPKDALAGWRFQAIDPAAFAGHFLSLVEDYPVRPDWSAGFVSWLLDQCNSRPGLGPLRLCEVANPKGAIVGCFAYHVTSRGRAVVLQILSRRGAEASVLQALIADATANHCVVVSGSTTQRVLEGLLRIPNVYYRHTCGTGVKTQQPDSLRAFLAGDALVGGLVGDSWTPLTSERYD